MEEYTKKVEELNDRDIYTPWITPEEDERMILNTEAYWLQSRYGTGEIRK